MPRPPATAHALVLLPALAAVAVALLLARRLLPEAGPLAHPLLPLWCAFVLTYVGVLSVSLLPKPLGGAIDRFLDRHLQQWGLGVYGVVALSFFLRLEAQSLLASLQAGFDGADFAQSMLRDWLLGFSAESLRNLVSAAIWPARLIQQHGVWAFLGFLGAASAVFALGRRLMPELQARVDGKPEKKEGKADQHA